jgi:hypothetical protein
MTDEYSFKERTYRMRSFIALKLAICLYLLKDSAMFIQFFLKLELCLCMFLQKEFVSYWGTVATKCTALPWIAYK